MTNRREFLQIGVTAGAWPLVARAAHAAGLGNGPAHLQLDAVVYDPRFAESVAFAQRSAAAGIETLAIEAGDMTALWYGRVYPRWQQGPAALAGLTPHGPMFCFAELARDVRMRVVFRGEHRGGAHASHAFTGPAPMLEDALRACGRSGSYGAALADVVARCPPGRHEILSGDTGRASAPGPDPLYTWLIAPAVRG